MSQECGDSLLDGLAPILHEKADGCGRRVELGDLVLVDYLPHAADIRIGGQTLELNMYQIHIKTEPEADGVNNLMIIT